MDMKIRDMTPEEIKYSYSQSQQLRMQCGSIGHLRGDFGSKGYEFYTTWDDHNTQLKTDFFKSELDEVINALRSDEYGLLKDRYAMGEFRRRYPESVFEGNYTTEYGFRADTPEHAYLLRCNPIQGDYNFYCFCYQSKWLDRNIEKARKGIRFIDSGYNELFRIPDSGKIVITTAWGEKMNRTCRYIDETHVEIGKELYHICQFAETMEKNGASYEPNKPLLPPKCYSVIPSSGELILIKNGEKGYFPTNQSSNDPLQNRTLADEKNVELGVSKAQEEAMLAGSMFGWSVPGADPNRYDETGNPKQAKKKDRESR